MPLLPEVFDREQEIGDSELQPMPLTALPARLFVQGLLVHGLDFQLAAMRLFADSLPSCHT